MKPEMNYISFLKVPSFVLEALMLCGQRPDVQKLLGWEFRGYNIGLLPRLGRILKFKKGFLQFGDEVVGYNVLIQQNSPYEPWIAVPDESNPKRHGFYKVYPADLSPRYRQYPHALIIDYSKGGNPIWDPSRFLRDFLVKPLPDNDDIYLGKAYVELGDRMVPVGYFVLERYNVVDTNLKLNLRL